MQSYSDWQDPIVPDEEDRCRYLRYKFENGQMLRQIDVRDSSGVLLYTLAFQEEEDVTPQVGDEALRIDYVDINSTQKSTTCTIVTITQEMIDGTITPTNLAPTDIALSNATIPENTGIGDTVGTLSTFDPNVGDTHTYTIISDPDDKFEISGDLLRLKNLVDFDVATTHNVTVRTTDQGLLSFDKAFTIVVTEVTQFINDKATLFQGDTFDTYMSGKPTDSILPGQGSFVTSCWVKKNNPIFTPTQVTNLSIWLDANDESSFTKDSSNVVSQWNDKSGNNNNAVQTTTSAKPIWTPSIIGTKPSVIFDGVDDTMSIPDTGDFSGDQKYTIFIVSQMPVLGVSTLDQTFISIGKDIGGTRQDVSIASNSPTLVGEHRNGGNTIWNTALTVDTPSIMSIRYNGGGGNSELWIDHVLRTVNSSANGAYNFATGETNIGISTIATFTDTFEGDISEILIYNRDLTEQERQDVETYLDEKWINPTSIVQPNDLSGLDLWLDADDDSTIVEISGDISEWADKSGNNNAVQTVASARPGKTLNGYGTRTTINLDGSDFLETTLDVNTDCTIFTVFAHDHGNTQPAGPLWQTRSNNTTSGFFPNWQDGQQYVAINSTWMSKTSTFTRNQFYNTSVVYDSSNNLTSLYSDGTLNDSASTIQPAGFDFTIGKRNADGVFYRGEIAEIIIYNRVLSTIERESIDTYLNQKWNNGIDIAPFKTLISLKQSAASGKIKAELQWNESDTLRALLYDSVLDDIKILTATGNWGDNQYHLINIRHDSIGSSTAISVDDNIYDTTSCVIAASGDGIMTLATDDGTNPFYDGLMDEVSIWDNAVNITDIYAGGYAVDLTTLSEVSSLRGWWRMGDQPDDYLLTDGILDRSGNAFHLTAHNMTSSNCVTDSVPALPVYTNSLSLPFNGVDQYGDTGISADMLVNDFSLSLWYKGTAPSYIMSQADSFPTYSSQWIIAGGGALFWFNSQTIGTIPSISDNVWHHISFSWNSTTKKYKGYLDGVLLGESGVVTPNTAVQNIFISTNPAFSAFTQGNLDEISLWNKALTDLEIAEIYNSGIPTDLDQHSVVGNRINWWRMGDDAADDENVVKDQNGNNDITLFNYLSNPYDPEIPT